MSRASRRASHDFRVLRKVLAIVLIGAVALVSHQGAAIGRPGGLDVLYVGNSLLGTRASSGEDTPDVVRRLARATGQTIRATKAIRFGSTLQRSWDTGLARRALNGVRRYDFIVLQEYSTLVATDPARVRRTLLRTYAPALARSLKPGGRVVLFKNWALTKPAPFRSRAENVAAIDAGYARLAADLPVPTVIAPISDTFETVVARHGTSPLIVPDGKHPTGQAVYLDAATLYALFFARSPRDLPNLYVKPTMARQLRDAAARTLGY